MTTLTSTDVPRDKARRTYKPTFDPRNPPPRVTRPLLAELLFVTLGLQVSPRTLEAWPLESRIVNGRATYCTADAIAYGQALLDGSPGLRGGRARAA